MARKNEHTDFKMDEQLLEEQGRMVTDIITNTTRRAIQEKSKRDNQRMSRASHSMKKLR